MFVFPYLQIGDLAGKYGMVDAMSNFSKTVNDWNLPMFGIYSIIGRSMVIHKTGGAR